MKGIIKRENIIIENKEKYENKKFDSKFELSKLNIKRLFTLQKIEIDNLRYYLENTYIYDKNDISKKIEEISIINLVITKKLHEEK